MKRLVLIVLAAFLALEASAQKIYLVAAGVSDYPGTDMDLNLPAEDARLINSLYKKNSNATTLLLTNSRATREAVLAAMKQLFHKAAPEDIVVFYFSGHGAPGLFATYGENLTYSDIKDVFSNCRSRHKMIFADACFSGALRQEGGSSSDAGNMELMLFLSSRHDEMSMELKGTANGVFTACLERCLRGAADVDKNRVVTAKELFDAVRAGVIYVTGDMQHPVMWGRFDDDMPVMIW